MKPYQVKEITTDHILFSNGAEISFDHLQECCEWNYADFQQLKDTVFEDTIFTEKLSFETTETGFRFGIKNNWFYVPCYSEQNGYYTSNIDIYYRKQRNGEAKKVLSFDAEFVETY